MYSKPQFLNNLNNFDVYNNPIYSPTSNEYFSLFKPQTEPFDDLIGFNCFNEDNDDNFLPWLQSPNNSFNNLDNVKLESKKLFSGLQKRNIN